jgi:hypothetical protein
LHLLVLLQLRLLMLLLLPVEPSLPLLPQPTWVVVMYGMSDIATSA